MAEPEFGGGGAPDLGAIELAPDGPQPFAWLGAYASVFSLAIAEPWFEQLGASTRPYCGGLFADGSVTDANLGRFALVFNAWIALSTLLFYLSATGKPRDRTSAASGLFDDKDPHRDGQAPMLRPGAITFGAGGSAEASGSGVAGALSLAGLKKRRGRGEA
jgi:hypothetical protein